MHNNLYYLQLIKSYFFISSDCRARTDTAIADQGIAQGIGYEPIIVHITLI